MRKFESGSWYEFGAWLLVALGTAVLIVTFTMPAPARAFGFNPFNWLEENQVTPSILPVQQPVTPDQYDTKKQICVVLHFGIGLPLIYSTDLIVEMRQKMGDEATKRVIAKTAQANRAYRCLCLAESELVKRKIRCAS